ncbi:MAG: patatin-like phospholipase family protein, partial [Janthinobacterium lividum]
MPEETFNIKSGKIPKMGETPDAESRETEQIANAMEESLKAARILEIVAAQSEQIEYLTFGGGGAKGTAYSGVYSALCEAKIMEGVAAITGSSAGAITAAIIATGIDPINFDKLLKNTDLSLLPGKGMLINKDGNPLYELIAENVAINISRYFKSKDKDISRLLLERNEIIIEELKGLEIEIASKNEEISTTDRELPKFESLSTELNKLEKRQYLLIKSKDTLGEKGHNLKDIINKANLGGEITFGDLGLLNALDPYTFKNLVITAVRRDNGQLTIFNPEDTPNVE